MVDYDSAINKLAALVEVAENYSPSPETTRRNWTREDILMKITASDKWLCRGILAIYNRQSETEKSQGATIHANGVGFNAFDADFLGSLAQKIQQGKSLTRKQLQAARSAMSKYCGQLAILANTTNAANT